MNIVLFHRVKELEDLILINTDNINIIELQQDKLQYGFKEITNKIETAQNEKDNRKKEELCLQITSSIIEVVAALISKKGI